MGDNSNPKLVVLLALSDNEIFIIYVTFKKRNLELKKKREGER